MTRSKDVDPTGQFERAQAEVTGISHEAIPPKLDSIEPEAGGLPAGVKVKALDLPTLLRHAFLAGRGLKDGDKLSAEDQAAWVDYDPECSGGVFRRIFAALYPESTSPAPVAVPAGYRLVPEEPTEEILDAFWYQTGESEEMRSRTHDRARRYWLAMLSASPVPSTATQAGAVTPASNEMDGGAE